MGPRFGPSALGRGLGSRMGGHGGSADSAVTADCAERKGTCSTKCTCCAYGGAGGRKREEGVGTLALSRLETRALSSDADPAVPPAPLMQLLATEGDVKLIGRRTCTHPPTPSASRQTHPASTNGLRCTYERNAIVLAGYEQVRLGTDPNARHTILLEQQRTISLEHEQTPRGGSMGQTICDAVCCRMLQCDAVCCRMLQCDAVCCRMLQCDAVCCRMLQCVSHKPP